MTSVLLERVEGLLADAVAEEDNALLVAGERGRALIGAGGASPGAGERAALAYAGETLGLLVLENRFGEVAKAVVELLRTETKRSGMSVRLDLYRELLRSRFLSELPPDMAAEGILRAAVSLGPLEEASLWQADAGADSCASPLSGGTPSPGASGRARELLRNGRVATTAEATSTRFLSSAGAPPTPGWFCALGRPTARRLWRLRARPLPS